MGFLPAGAYLGQQIAALPQPWLLIPIGMLMGWFIVQAEPAVHVLNRQVEEITSGAIPVSTRVMARPMEIATPMDRLALMALPGMAPEVISSPA